MLFIPQRPARKLRALVDRAVRSLARSAGFELIPIGSDIGAEIDQETAEIIHRVRPFTLTSPERLVALCSAVDYVVQNQIAGSVVECGVWRGGSMMAAALRLKACCATDRNLILYDTFTGMTSPTSKDRRAGSDRTAQEDMSESDPHGLGWFAADLPDVRANLSRTNYPSDHIHYIVGPVEETLPAQVPEGGIAILRLDTDWYESTRHELRHLYDHIVPGGVLIIDDYGFWEGARVATDEFLSNLQRKPLLVRVDPTARIAVVP